MSSFESDGFLSEESEDFRVCTRTRFADLVRECEEVSRCATMKVFAQEITNPTGSSATAASLWIRCLSACQAAILLAERGMGVEAIALLRTAYENLFFFAALIKKPEIISDLSEEDKKQRIKQISAILKDEQIGRVLPDEVREQLEASLRNTAVSKKSISAFDAAQIAEMTGIYNTAWRTFSLLAAHSTFTAAGHAFGENLVHLQFGLSFDYVEMALGLARDCIRLGLEQQPHFSVNKT